MLVRCISTKLSDDQLRQIKMGKSPDYQFRIGGIYLVLGITFLLPDEPHGGGVLYEVLNDFDGIRSVPACLFELVDNRCSKYWVARSDDDGAFLLWPEEFFAEYFHDRLSEGVAEVREVFDQVVRKIRLEVEENR
jgi:hypothetical protein